MLEAYRVGMVITRCWSLAELVLQEKDDANFKLMSERIKSNSVHKLLLEEKELLHSQLNAMAVERQRSALHAISIVTTPL